MRSLTTSVAGRHRDRYEIAIPSPSKTNLAGFNLLGVVGLIFGCLDDGLDAQAKGFGELEIALVVGRYSHDRARSISGQNVIRDPDRDAFARYGIGRVASGKDARLGTITIGSFAIALEGSRVAILGHFSLLLWRGQATDEGMLWGDDHVGCAEERVGSCRIDSQGRIVGVGCQEPRRDCFQCSKSFSGRRRNRLRRLCYALSILLKFLDTW